MLFPDRSSRETRAQRRTFAAGRAAETSYRRSLRRAARAIGDLVRSHVPGSEQELVQSLRDYAQALRPWARATAARMLQDVSRRDETAWAEIGKQMRRALREEIRSAPTGARLRSLLEEQVELITSLPLDAATRVHQIATGQLYSGARPEELRRQIMLTGHVTRTRADLIARTETARATTTLTQARAEHVGSEGYVWRTAEDADVRPLHRKLAGKFFRWDDPPVSGERGERSHPGAVYNCRCYPEVVIPGERKRNFTAARAA
jgi:SPP1 gp7 family putative phage head morphogenesis protein